MKKTILSLIIFSLFIFGCNQATKKQSENTESADMTVDVDYKNAKILDTLYVIDKKGVEYKQKPDANSETLGVGEYGSELAVIETGKEWLGIRGLIRRKFDTENGSEWEWKKVYVPKSAVGNFSQIKLVQEDLNIIFYIEENKKRQDYEEGKKLTKYLKVELIDKNLYESKKANAVYFLKSDTTEIRKENGVIKLPCTQQDVTFTDNTYIGDGMQNFTYLGQMENLNKYLVAGLYYEGSDYKFIDRENGNEISFIGFPNVSPDETHIIAIYTNPYERCADLTLYSIDNQKIKFIISVGYKNWMPNVTLNDKENSQMFFSSDGYLYVTVKHEKAYWSPDNKYNTDVQYIRIKIL